MPLHDWTRVDAGIYHGFHIAWIAAIRGQLNGGLLPPEYYADAEQVVRPREADVLVLREPASLFGPANGAGGVAVAQSEPRTRLRQVMRRVPPLFPKQRRVVVRHVSGDRVVALIELVSPANKDRPGSVADFVRKVTESLWNGVHVLVLDPFPPGDADPTGIPGAVAEAHYDDPPQLPAGEPLTFTSYSAGPEVKAFVECRAVGADLPTVPLFLTAERYIEVPLAPTYDRAWAETPARWRDVIAPPG
jgi:hypothetical protein